MDVSDPSGAPALDESSPAVGTRAAAAPVASPRFMQPTASSSAPPPPEQPVLKLRGDDRPLKRPETFKMPDEFPPEAWASSGSSFQGAPSRHKIPRDAPSHASPRSSAAHAGTSGSTTHRSGGGGGASARGGGASGAARLAELATTKGMSTVAAPVVPPTPRTKPALVTAMAETCDVLKSVEEDWEKRTAAIQRIPSLLTAGAELACLESLIEGLHKPLSVQATDLRSSVVRVTCSTLQAMVKEHGKALSSIVAGILPALLKNLFVSVKAISAASHDTAVALVSAVPTAGTLSVLLTHASDSHHQTRRGCAEYMAVLLQDGPSSDGSLGGGATSRLSQGLVDGILKALKALTGDPNGPVREAAAKAFWVVFNLWPGPAEAMRGRMDPAQLKLIKRVQPK